MSTSTSQKKERRTSPKKKLSKSCQKMKFVSSHSKETITSTTTTSDGAKRRGMNTMPRVVKRKIKGIKPVVEYNTKGQPHGQAAKEMQSYIGVLARTRVPIEDIRWPEVDKNIKMQLWEAVEV